MIAAKPIDSNLSNNQGADFASLLDEYDFEMPYRGQILEGTILNVSDNEVLLDVGLKRDAVVPRKDLDMMGEQLRQKLIPGNTVMAYVLQPRDYSGELLVSINKAQELEDWQSAQSAMEEGGIVEATVSGSNKGGILVDYNRLTGFVPQSHIISLPRFASQDELHAAKKQMIGESLSLKFIEIDRRRNRLILSERAAKTEIQQTRMSELEVGQVITGRVVSIVDFGAFVDLGGVDGLIHISKLAHSHVNHPGEVLSVGDEVSVLVSDVDADNERISLDRTAVLPDPWDTVLDEYQIGNLVETKVTNVVDFGAFAQLPNGLQGLVHASQMSMFGSSNPHDLLKEGDAILVRIVSIEPDQRRIGLSMDQVSVEEQETWLHERHEMQTVAAIQQNAVQIPAEDVEDAPEASTEAELDSPEVEPELV